MSILLVETSLYNQIFAQQYHDLRLAGHDHAEALRRTHEIVDDCFGELSPDPLEWDRETLERGG